MKNKMKKIVVLLFSAMFSLPILGMIDTDSNENVMLSDHHDIVVKESVQSIIEKNNISREMVAELYNSIMEDSSICFYEGSEIMSCGNARIEINILKSDYSIVDLYIRVKQT